MWCFFKVTNHGLGSKLSCPHNKMIKNWTLKLKCVLKFCMNLTVWEKKN